MTGTGDGDVNTDTVVGRLFVEALNAGLARARGGMAVPTRHAGPAPGPRQPADPFATAVLASFDATLSGMLSSAERRDVALQVVLRRRGRQVLAAALAAARQPAQYSPPEARGELGQAHETLVRTLLLESAALTVLEERRFPADAVRPADLVRVLGRFARTARRGPAQVA